MIAYKWTHKRNGKYYSLLNFGYFRLNKSILINQSPYEIGNTYINDETQTENIKKQFLNMGRCSPPCVKTGFYFWKKNIEIPESQKKKMRKCGASINAILKCEIKNEDILSIERGNTVIRAKRFKVLKEIK